MKLSSALTIAAICTAATDAFSPSLPQCRITSRTTLPSLSASSDETSTPEEDDANTPAAPAAATPLPELPKISPKFVPLDPVVAALDPKYKCTEPVGTNDFILSRTGEATDSELTNENLLKIVTVDCTDLEVNTLVWKCLGYRFDEEVGDWNTDDVFPLWKKKYPLPPDFVNMSRMYAREYDEKSLLATRSLVRSIPMDFKQSLKEQLRPLGWSGYKLDTLTPNKTRRAQCANWLMYYRMEVKGYTIEELQERRRLKKEKEEAEKRRLEEESGEKGEDGWQYPLKEVY